jgi:rSAM/selenodomain-associated transferase 1
MVNAQMKYPQGKILVFCKAPEPGAVKTRLQPAFSPVQCAQLHARLAQHTLQTAVDSGVAEVELWSAGDPEHPFFKECERRCGVGLKQQQGADLGMRMTHALQTALHSSAFAIIIGTDCPALGTAHLQAAAGFLADNSEPQAARVVIGPAFDGGYVLFGADRTVTRAFENIDWGSNRVLQQTRDRLHNPHTLYKELETLWDVDRPEDLQRLPALLKTFQ